VAITRDANDGAMAIYVDGALAMNEVEDPDAEIDPNDPNAPVPTILVPATSFGPTGPKDAPAYLAIGAMRFEGLDPVCVLAIPAVE
jgi:hypothetical protein